VEPPWGIEPKTLRITSQFRLDRQGSQASDAHDVGIGSIGVRQAGGHSEYNSFALVTPTLKPMWRAVSIAPSTLGAAADELMPQLLPPGDQQTPGDPAHLGRA
jgi:hypothetical protein